MTQRHIVLVTCAGSWWKNCLPLLVTSVLLFIRCLLGRSLEVAFFLSPSILKPCLIIIHLVAAWTVIYHWWFIFLPVWHYSFSGTNNHNSRILCDTYTTRYSRISFIVFLQKCCWKYDRNNLCFVLFMNSHWPY